MQLSRQRHKAVAFVILAISLISVFGTFADAIQPKNAGQMENPTNNNAKTTAAANVVVAPLPRHASLIKWLKNGAGACMNAMCIKEDESSKEIASPGIK